MNSKENVKIRDVERLVSKYKLIYEINSTGVVQIPRKDFDKFYEIARYALKGINL